MSGGSYDYLCLKDSDTLLEMKHQIEAMSARLAGLGYAEDAALETEDVLLTVRQFENRMQASINRLRDVWRAVEWWDSGDCGEDSLKEALNEYRKNGTTRNKI